MPLNWLAHLITKKFKFDQDISVLQIFRKFMAKVMAFFEKKEGRQCPISCPTSYMCVIRCLKVLKGRFCEWQKQSPLCLLWKRCSQIFHSIHRKTSMLECLLNKIAGLQPATLSKKRFHYRCFSCEFSEAHFFKYTSRWLLLEEHWISLKMVPVVKVFLLIEFSVPSDLYRM